MLQTAKIVYSDNRAYTFEIANIKQQSVFCHNLNMQLTYQMQWPDILYCLIDL